MSDRLKDWIGSSYEDIFNNLDVWSSCQYTSFEVNKNHKVLFHLPLPSSQEALPVPQRGRFAWDQDHVRLPSSNESQYSEIDEEGKSVLKRRWDLIEQSLLHPFRTSRELEKAIKLYNTRYENVWNFYSLHELFERHFSPEDSIKYFDEIIPKIIRLALQLPQLIQCPLPLLKQGMNKSISLSQQQVACLLANSFLCTFPRRNTDKRKSEYANYPSINFNKLYGSRGQNVIEKLVCICNYFQRVLTNKMPTNVITFQRRSLEDPFHWDSSVVKLSRTKFHVTSTGKIEEGFGMLQVDFANRFVGGGVLGHGCVQEEIRFVINPEMIVARLFTECLKDEEALIMIGCEQFNLYSGYASNFRWAGDFFDPTPIDINRRRKTRVVAIDALPYRNNYEQFKEDKFLRELLKAYAGFYNDGTNDRSPVASGLWGCGAFNGNVIRSALIQLMACSVAQRNIVFYTFGDELLRNEVADIYKYLIEMDVTVCQLYRILNKFQYDGETNQLVSFIKKEVNLMDRPVSPQGENNRKHTKSSHQQSIFNFLEPSTSSSSSERKEETELKRKNQQSTFNTQNYASSSRPSQDKLKFEEIENQFAMFKNATDGLKQEPKKMSLIESLDFDMEKSSKASNSNI